MFKKLQFAIMIFIATMGLALAATEINKADHAQLDSVKGIGATMSKAIIEERKIAGDFKDWPDFQRRVKGVNDKNSSKLSDAGLTVNGQAKPGTQTTAPQASDKKVDLKKDNAKK